MESKEKTTISLWSFVFGYFVTSDFYKGDYILLAIELVIMIYLFFRYILNDN